MTEERIDTLRNMIAAIGKQQIAYHEFFPTFADTLVVGLGKYLGDEKSVALTTDEEEYQFDIMYRHEGLKLTGGRYQIPIMVKFDNLGDSGFLLQRIWLFCSKNGDRISVSINDERSVEIQEHEAEVLYEEIYKFLRGCFSDEGWFAENRRDYQATGIGFLS